MTQEVTVVLVLAALQVLALRVSQYALPQFYFASGSLFLRRSEVTVGAILFRLSIPFAAGLMIPLMVSANELWVAAAAGGLAWFLMLWPIAWAPNVMLPLENRRWIVLLLLGFWLAFAVLPLGGATLTMWVRDAVTDSDASWWRTALSQELLFLVPITVGLTFLARVAGRSVSFHDDEPEVDTSEEVDWSNERSESRRWYDPAPWHLTVALLAVVLIPVILVVMLISLVRSRK
jgi:hypothetical protein